MGKIEEQEENEEQKYFFAYTLKLINYLTHKDHDIIKIVDSDKDPTGYFKVAIFENTDELQKDYEHFMKHEEKQRKKYHKRS